MDKNIKIILELQNHIYFTAFTLYTDEQRLNLFLDKVIDEYMKDMGGFTIVNPSKTFVQDLITEAIIVFQKQLDYIDANRLAKEYILKQREKQCVKTTRKKNYLNI